MPQDEHGSTVNPTALAVVFLAMIFGVIFVLLILTAYFNNYTYTYKAQLKEGVPEARAIFETERTNSATRLASYGWIDRDAGTVHTPIENAYDAVVAQYAEGADGR